VATPKDAMSASASPSHPRAGRSSQWWRQRAGAATPAKKFSLLSVAMAGGLVIAGVTTAAIPDTGHTPTTHDSLAAANAASSSVASSPAVNLDDCPILTEGYPPGGCVIQLQTELNTDNGTSTPVDGVFGPQTKAAVITFQQNQHIVPADGIVGPQTKAALGNPGSSSAGNPAGQLNPGQQITSGTQIASPDGKFVLQMQSDGNLVLRAPGNVPLEDTHTAGHDGTIAVMQADGNFVLIAPGNIPVWSSGTNGHPGTVLQVQDDGNVVLYAPGHQVLRVLFSTIPDPQNSVTTPTAPPATAPAVSPPTPVNHNYPASFNPQAAATWAVSNALVPLPVPGSLKKPFSDATEPCTTFVSWALAKGGMPEEADWFPYWDSPSTQHSLFLYMSSSTPAPAWYAANDFVSRFTGLGWATERQIYPGSIPADISVGDVIYYQWDGTPSSTHLAMVTSIVDGQIKVTDQGGHILYPSSRNRLMLTGHAGDDLTKTFPHLKVFVIHWQ
jgi:peptidoglycan hydrolase-like protein with peptidoglycan-binding domain